MTRGSRRTSSGVPSAIFSPWSRTVTRSLMPMTTFMSCSMSRTVRPSSRPQPVDERHHLGRLARVHPGRRLVEQEELGLAAEGARDLEPALVAVRQVLCEVAAAARQADQREELARPRTRDSRSSRRLRGVDSRASSRSP